MDRLFIREPRSGDIGFLAQHLRQADRSEVLASVGDQVPISDVLAYSVLTASRCWVAATAHEPVAVFGVTPLTSCECCGSPWLLGTERLRHYSQGLVREGRRYVAEMLRDYSRLLNYVDARNTASVRWLKHLGFTLHDTVPRGPWGVPFHPFEKSV